VWQLSFDDPWQVCLGAAQLGGDSDTIGAMAGAMAGARCGADAWPAAARQQVEAVNHLDVWRVADALLNVRHAL
jgi:ADP-ribosylglycohydrolase